MDLMAAEWIHEQVRGCYDTLWRSELHEQPERLFATRAELAAEDDDSDGSVALMVSDTFD